MDNLGLWEVEVVQMNTHISLPPHEATTQCETKCIKIGVTYVLVRVYAVCLTVPDLMQTSVSIITWKAVEYNLIDETI